MKHPWAWVRFMLSQKEVVAVESWYAEEIRKAKEEGWDAGWESGFRCCLGMSFGAPPNETSNPHRKDARR